MRRKKNQKARLGSKLQVQMNSENIAFIPVWPDAVAVVDVDMEPLLAAHKWTLTNGYAFTTVDGRQVQMAHLVCEPTGDMVVDHANRVKLDNRRCNLRHATRRENSLNRSVNKGKDLPKGVVRAHLGRGFKAQIKIRGKLYVLGIYTSVSEAQRVYDETAKAVFGEFAATNEKMSETLPAPQP